MSNGDATWTGTALEMEATVRMGRPAIVLVVLFCVGAYLALAGYMVMRVVRKRASEIEASLSDREIIKLARNANLFGQTSRRYSQLRGNGMLVLTPEALSFYMFAPRREYRIPLENIVGFEHPKRFRGRIAFRELLLVRCRDEAGAEDALCIYVEDPRGWAEALVAAGAGDGEPPDVR